MFATYWTVSRPMSLAAPISHLHVVEPDMLVEAARGGGLSKPPEIAWAGVVGRERHKRPVGVLERRVVHIPVANEPKVRRAGVDVRLHVAIDASDVERRRGGGRGEYLHDAHRTSGAAAGLIELGFLIALGHQHQ